MLSRAVCVAATVAACFLGGEGARPKCNAFFTRAAELDAKCVVTEGGERYINGCEESCVSTALSLRTDTTSYTDCYNLHPCRNITSTGTDPTQMMSFAACPTESCATYQETCDVSELYQKDAARPHYHDVGYKCPDASGNLEFDLPCIKAGEKKYFEIQVNNLAGLEYSVYSKSGGPVGLMELFAITDLENDEVLDCFPVDTVDSSNCPMGTISRGIRLQRPYNFKDESTNFPIRFGFKGCAETTTCNNGDNVMVFRTVGLVGAEEKGGCMSPIAEATPKEGTLCVLSGALPQVPHALMAVLVLAVLAVMG
eukprot:TRINITY_DN21127_c0_g2_i1.p1 TRINITY_DN21127_c0_g2~~TRINITY_DN21127_c0_g2_i1.p1  ORF type:complete len:311 (+),score=103.74 TRINITY_DN21127_c0_g2_i1:148-1080(+)